MLFYYVNFNEDLYNYLIIRNQSLHIDVSDFPIIDVNPIKSNVFLNTSYLNKLVI